MLHDYLAGQSKWSLSIEFLASNITLEVKKTFANFHEFSTFENEKNNYDVYIDMFIELLIYHKYNHSEQTKLKVFVFRQKLTEKYFMQILNAEKA